VNDRVRSFPPPVRMPEAAGGPAPSDRWEVNAPRAWRQIQAIEGPLARSLRTQRRPGKRTPHGGADGVCIS